MMIVSVVMVVSLAHRLRPFLAVARGRALGVAAGFDVRVVVANFAVRVLVGALPGGLPGSLGGDLTSGLAAAARWGAKASCQEARHNRGRGRRAGGPIRVRSEAAARTGCAS